MACDVFETEAWFANLLAHGFERPPHKNWEWRAQPATLTTLPICT